MGEYLTKLQARTWLSRAVFTGGLSNKPFLIWLLTTPPHFKHVATLPCNLSLIACFLELMFTQGSVATCAGTLGELGFSVAGLLQIYKRIFQL